MKGMNKKGSEMTLGTIIAIVLGITVLVFLIFGFSTGWNNMWDKVSNLGGGNVNVGTIKTACVLACQQKDVYGFNSQQREVILEDGVKGTGSCKEFAEENVNFKKGSEDVGKKDVGITLCSGLN